MTADWNQGFWNLCSRLPSTTGHASRHSSHVRGSAPAVEVPSASEVESDAMLEGGEGGDTVQMPLAQGVTCDAFSNEDAQVLYPIFLERVLTEPVVSMPITRTICR